MAEVLHVSELRVANSRTGAPLVSDINLTLEEGELVGLVGESGSGKTTIGLSCLGFQRPGTRRERGDVVIGKTILSLQTASGLARLRRQDVAYVPQSATSALNPALTIGAQLRDRLPKGERRSDARLLDALEQVALPRTEEFLRRYPHQLSGGQQQRVTIAAALMNDPKLIIFDEPTTGLDVAVQEQILDMIRSIFSSRRVAGLFISHDLAAVAQLCSRTVVMRSGGIVEEGLTPDVLRTPKQDYVRELVAAVPSLARNLAGLNDPPTKPTMEHRGRSLSVEKLNAFHGSKQTLFDVDISFPAGSCTAIVGESGSGKTTLCRAMIGLHRNYRGRIALDGSDLDKDAASRNARDRREVQYIFQSPYEALNPRLTVRELVAQPLRFFGENASAEFIAAELDRVALARGAAEKYPHQLSGGERQRVAIARALALRPSVVICDEITSALDVSVQAKVVELIGELRREMGLTVIFVTHNLALVPEIAEHVAVMRQGRVVEAGRTADVFTKPASDFTRTLLQKTPDIIHAWSDLQ